MQLTNWKNIFGEDYYKFFQIKDNSKKEVNFLIKYLKLKKNDNILDIGCGNGRHLFELYKKGFRKLFGIDLSKNFIKKAKETNNEIDFINKNFIIWKCKKKFNKAYSFFSSFGYYTDDNNEKYIKKVSQILIKNGIFLLDLFNYSYFIKNFKKKIKTKKGELLITNINEFNKRTSINRSIVIIKNIKTKKTKKYEFRIRYYSVSEIKELLEKSNFKIINILGNYKGNKLSAKSRRMIFIAVRK